MALDTRTSFAAVTAQAQTLAQLLNGGYLRIYSGARPAQADSPLAGQTLLAELPFATPAAESVADGVVTFAALVNGVVVAAGQASWFRAVRSDGTTAVFDGSVGVSNANLLFTDVNFQVGGRVEVDSLTYTVPRVRG